MDDDQQFCLRWNNHQSTLISVFDTLLENETLVDCTLAAEGKFLKAHKVVLSACSPYFAALMQEQYDKHPIFILKDVKYQELRAMMDYMYRGEVNISQDQLAALLKAAESLQIKGLSDNRTGGGNVPKHEQPQPQPHRGLGLASSARGGGGGNSAVAGGYTLEQTKRARLGPASIDSQELSGSREGSSSPTSRRRRKVRRRSIDNAMSAEVHDNSNSSQIQPIATTSSILQQQSNASLSGVGAIAAAASALASQVPAAVGVGLATAPAASTIAAVTAIQPGTTQQQLAAASTNVTKKTESVKGGGGSIVSASGEAMHGDILVNIEEQQQQQQLAAAVELKSEKQNHKQQKSVLGKDVSAAGSSVTSAELVIEPKSEYDEEGNDENVEDLTLDDEDMGMEDLDHNAGTSHGNEGSSQGYAQWQHDRSQDEVFMATQDAQQRDPQDLSITRIAGLTWNEWNARLAMPLVTQLREGTHPLVFPTDLSVDKHNNHSTTSSAVASTSTSASGSSAVACPASAAAGVDRKSPCFAVGTAAPLNSAVASTSAPPPPQPDGELCGSSTSLGGSTVLASTTPLNCTANLTADKLQTGKLKHLSEEEAAALMLKAANEKAAANNSGNLSDNSYGGDDAAPGNAGDYHSALSGAGAFGEVVGNAAGLCNINILSSISAMNSLIGGGNGGIGIGGAGGHPCPECGRVYKLKSSLRNHQKWECGKEPQFQCPFCVYRAKQKMHIGRHMERMHKEKFLKLDDIKSYTGSGGGGSSAEDSAAAVAAAAAAAAAAAGALVTAADLRQHFS